MEDALDALAALERITQDLSALTSSVESCRTKNVGVELVQAAARGIARSFFQNARAELLAVQKESDLVDRLDDAFQTLLELSSKPTPKSHYARRLAPLKALVLAATVDVMKSRGERRLVLSQTEGQILETLQRMLPAAAASYEQALRDLRQSDRVSWRGPANELREILREAIDYLAPDESVRAAPGFALEDGRSGPTQKQKVRFILKARKSGSTAVEVAQSSLTAVEEAIASLARNTYERSNASTHASKGTKEISNLKRYVDALLGELLEIN